MEVDGDSAPLTVPEPADAEPVAPSILNRVGGWLVVLVLWALVGVVAAFLLLLVGGAVGALSRLLGAPLPHSVRPNQDLTWGTTAAAVVYGLVAALIALGLYGLARRAGPAGKRAYGRIIGIPVLLAVAASAVWAFLQGVRPDFTLGAVVACLIGVYRLLRGRPMFEDGDEKP